jgi:hypothetical protein
VIVEAGAILSRYTPQLSQDSLLPLDVFTFGHIVATRIVVDIEFLPNLITSFDFTQ